MKKGFTLIELLVVIGILGILAAGLLAAIDPLEQLKRGRDTTRKNIAVEFVNANTRYYSVYGTMPWGNGALPIANIGNVQAIVSLLTTAGELKTTYQQGLGNALTSGAYALSVIGGANGTGISVCFDPESKAVSRDVGTMVQAAGVLVPLVTGTNPGNTDTGWYWCAN